MLRTLLPAAQKLFGWCSRETNIPILDIFRLHYIKWLAMPITFARSVLSVLALLTAFAIFSSAANAAELVMFRRDGCPYCATWDREIGPIYPKTDIARRAPLRIVDIDRSDDPGIRTRSPILYTPTFVLVANGEELGRIEGYPGDAFFWGLLDRLLDKLLPQSPNGASVTSADMPSAGRVEHAL
jgi:hypothetical protein